jgi:UDP-3-O-[3-hydroxymyristoyl] glucosamine N-acyltransferase
MENADSFGQSMKHYSNAERLEYAKAHKGDDVYMVNDGKGNFYHYQFRPPNDLLIGWNNVIGNDGFGYARAEDGTLVKMPHRGNVIIEDNVEIGSNTCIDRAVEGSTIIGSGTKIDNNVHIAHGVKIGKNCLIVAGSVIGGSTEIGDNCYIGINASIKNKIKIGNNVVIGMGAVVLRDVPDGVTIVGNPGKELLKNTP